MSESAQIVVAALELRRCELLTHAMALDAERSRLAYAAITGDNVVARGRFHELDEQACRLAEEIGLTDLALAEARRRATVKDWRQQFAEITGIGVGA